MKPPFPDIDSQVLRDFRHWSKDRLPPDTNMVGQTESHFPCKAAYAVAVYDHDEGRYTQIKVMEPHSGRVGWRSIELD